MASRMCRATSWVLVLCGMLVPFGAAWAQQVQITSLSDVSFGMVSSVATNRTASQSLCVYTGSLLGYTVTGTGSGSSGAFTLANAGNSNVRLAYTAQWAFAGGQTAGTLMTPGQGVRSSGGLNLLCSLGSLLAGTASLIITLPSTSLSAASAGSYSGTLSLMVSPN